MLISIASSMIDVEKIYSAIISYQDEEKKVACPDGFLGIFTTYKIEKQFKNFTLTVDYLSTDGTRYIFTASNATKPPLEENLKSLINQIKGYDGELVTAAFESAVFGDQK